MIPCTFIIAPWSGSCCGSRLGNFGGNGLPGISLVEIIFPFLSIPSTILPAQLAFKEFSQVVVSPIIIV